MTGSAARSKSSMDPRAFVAAVEKKVEQLVGCPALRVYWYDAAKDGVRTAEQLLIAELPSIKLRLGRLSSNGQQKGVDALIYRDMITLAQNRAVGEMVLISGDEDLHEGVTAVQDLGVRVTLLGIEPVTGRQNQSRELVLDADQHDLFSRSELTSTFTPLQPLGASADMSEPVDSPLTHALAAKAFADSWLATSTPSDRADLLAAHPRVPLPLDRELLSAVEGYTRESLRGNDAAHRKCRQAFWAAIKAATGPA